MSTTARNQEFVCRPHFGCRQTCPCVSRCHWPSGLQDRFEPSHERKEENDARNADVQAVELRCLH